MQAHLRHRLEQGERALLAELGRRTTAEADLQAAYDQLRLLHEVAEKGLTAQIAELQKAAVASQRKDKTYTLLDEATWAARAVAYEIESFAPVVYRGFSPSAKVFGIDVDGTLRGERTYHDILHPDDFHALRRRLAGVEFSSETRYVFLYRVLMPEPRWVMDASQPIFEADGRFKGLVGLAVDVHDLVLAGVIEPRFNVTATPAGPRRESVSSTSS